MCVPAVLVRMLERDVGEGGESGLRSWINGPKRTSPETTTHKLMAVLPYQPAGRSRDVWHGMVDEDDLDSSLPKELNTIDHPRFLAVSKDKLTVRYVGRGNHSQDVGAVRTEWPCPQRCLVYYFEVRVRPSTCDLRGALAYHVPSVLFAGDHCGQRHTWLDCDRARGQALRAEPAAWVGAQLVCMYAPTPPPARLAASKASIQPADVLPDCSPPSYLFLVPFSP